MPSRSAGEGGFEEPVSKVPLSREGEEGWGNGVSQLQGRPSIPAYAGMTKVMQRSLKTGFYTPV